MNINLINWLKCHKLKTQDFAADIGVTRQMAYLYIKGENFPSLQTRNMIAAKYPTCPLNVEMPAVSMLTIITGTRKISKEVLINIKIETVKIEYGTIEIVASRLGKVLKMEQYGKTIIGVVREKRLNEIIEEADNRIRYSGILR